LSSSFTFFSRKTSILSSWVLLPTNPVGTEHHEIGGKKYMKYPTTVCDSLTNLTLRQLDLPVVQRDLVLVLAELEEEEDVLHLHPRL